MRSVEPGWFLDWFCLDFQLRRSHHCGAVWVALLSWESGAQLRPRSLLRWLMLRKVIPAVAAIFLSVISPFLFVVFGSCLPWASLKRHCGSEPVHDVRVADFEVTIRVPGWERVYRSWRSISDPTSLMRHSSSW